MTTPSDPDTGAHAYSRVLSARSRVVAGVCVVLPEHVISHLPVDDIARAPLAKLKFPFFFSLSYVVYKCTLYVTICYVPSHCND